MLSIDRDHNAAIEELSASQISDILIYPTQGSVQ